jgi:GAF domain-containing protein
MKDEDKTKEQLLDELIQMRRCMAELEDVENERKQVDFLIQLQRDLALALGVTSSMAEALKRLLEASLQIEGIDSGAVYLMNPARGDFQLISNVGLSPPFIDRVSYYSPESPQVRLVMQGEPTYWPEVSGMLDHRSLLEEEGLTSLAVIPVKSEGDGGGGT